MATPRRRRELGRGERVLPGVWRLRLPLPWPGVPHGNAWALAAGDGIVLVDTGVHEPGSMGHLELAMDQVGLKLEQVVGIERVILRLHEVFAGEAMDRVEVVPEGEHLDMDDIAFSTVQAPGSAIALG